MIWSVKCSFVINLVLVFKQYVKTMRLSKFSIELILLVKPFFFFETKFSRYLGAFNEKIP